MEQLPNWLTDTIAAAGMTAYADDLYPKHKTEVAISADPADLDQPPTLQ